MMDDASSFDWTETLRNGAMVRIRPLRQDDRARVAKAFQLLDRASVYSRLFAFKNELTEADLDRIMTIDPDREVALVVTSGTADDSAIIGSGRYVVTGADGTAPAAEVAFVVEEEYHGLGIASRLLAHLAEIARAAGIAVFEADVLSDNKAMLAVLSRSGLPMRARHDHGIAHVTLSLQPKGA